MLLLLLLLPMLLLSAAGAGHLNKLCPKALILNSYNYPTHYLTKNGKNEIFIAEGNGTRFREVPALDGSSDSVSFEVLVMKNRYLCNRDNEIKVDKCGNKIEDKVECSFKLINVGEGYFRVNPKAHPNHFLRHQSYKVKLNKLSDTPLFKNDSMFGAICTSDKQFKLDVCDGKFTLTASNIDDGKLQAEPDKIIYVKKGKPTYFKFVSPALNGNKHAVSIEALDNPGYFLTTLMDHYVQEQKRKNTKEYNEAASFKVIAMRNGFVRLQSMRNPRYYIRHREFKLRIDRWTDTTLYDKDSSWKLNCHVEPCKTKHFVYNPKYEHLHGPHCEFAPNNWNRINKWCADKKENRQSPINVQLKQCKTKSKDVKPIKLGKGWHKEMKFIINNNGHSLQGIAVDSSKLIVSGGHLKGKFNCFQFHFHWGSVEKMKAGYGSEHQLFDIDGKRTPTPMEVHIVCKKLNMNLTAAASTPDAVAVLAGFIHTLEPKEHDGWAGHVIAQVLLKFKPLIAPAVGAAANASDTVELQLRDLLPESLHRFVNYDGSFTTPNCDPITQWHIFPDPMKVRWKLLKQFTKTFFDAEKKRPMINTNRPVMNQYDRELRCSFSSSDVRSAEIAKAASGGALS